jgi:hypothetical protein
MLRVYYMVPAARYGEFVLRESALLSGFSVLALGGSAIRVGRRGP